MLQGVLQRFIAEMASVKAMGGRSGAGLRLQGCGSGAGV